VAGTSFSLKCPWNGSWGVVGNEEEGEEALEGTEETVSMWIGVAAVGPNRKADVSENEIEGTCRITIFGTLRRSRWLDIGRRRSKTRRPSIYRGEEGVEFRFSL